MFKSFMEKWNLKVGQKFRINKDSKYVYKFVESPTTSNYVLVQHDFETLRPDSFWEISCITANALDSCDVCWEPCKGDRYFYINITDYTHPFSSVWENDEVDNTLWKNGMAFSTEKEAKEFGKELVEFCKSRRKF